MHCPLCNNELRDTANFCVKCGNKVPRCPTCGRVITKRSRFCVNDGTMIPEDILAVFPASNVPAARVQQENNRPVPVVDPKPAATLQNTGHVLQMSAPNTASGSTGKPKKKKTLLIILLILLAALMVTAAGLLILKNFTGGNASNIAETTETTEETQPAESVAAGDPAATEEQGSLSNHEQAPAETTAPTIPASTEAAVNTEATTPTIEPPAPLYVMTYEIIPGDLSWQEAKLACEARGGKLASINSVEEYNYICKLANESGLRYLWLGACLYSESDEWSNCTWLTGEPWGFEVWYPNEPSKVDADGTKEYYLCMWLAKYNNEDIGWTFNDQRNDIVADFPNVSGKIGYVCEYVMEATP